MMRSIYDGKRTPVNEKCESGQDSSQTIEFKRMIYMMDGTCSNAPNAEALQCVQSAWVAWDGTMRPRWQ
jgi:hypothetical protein